MENLFDLATAAEVQERLRCLGPRSERQWGKMTVAQAVEHCAIAMEWAVDDLRQFGVLGVFNSL